ncbi:MAG: TlpA disulfide reductase family protein [Bacteroidota bacterium]
MRIRGFLFLICISVGSCDDRAAGNTNTIISGRILERTDSSSLFIRAYGQELDYSLPIYLDTLETKNDGTFFSTLKLERASEIVIENDNVFLMFYLESQDSIYFEATEGYLPELRNYTGRGSEKLEVFNEINPKFSFQDYKVLDSLEIMNTYLDQLREYQILIDRIKDQFSEDFVNYVTAQMTYANFHFSNVFPWFYADGGRSFSFVDSLVSKSRDDLVKEARHGVQSHDYAEDLLYVVLSRYDTISSKTDFGEYEYYMETVETLELDSAGYEKMKALGFWYFLSQGLAPQIKNDLEAYLVHNISYREVLTAELDAWMKLAPGNPAPNFSAIDNHGNPFQLSDLKGAVIYMDVWATWCAPCIEEFEYSKALRKRLSDYAEVEFLYVSIDDNKERWHAFLGRNLDLQGTHVLSQGDLDSQMAKKYKINGIPRYIIILSLTEAEKLCS